MGTSHAALSALMPEDWDAQAVYDHHEVLMIHGQRVCHWRDPACTACVLLDICPTGQARMAAPPGTVRFGARVPGKDALR